MLSRWSSSNPIRKAARRFHVILARGEDRGYSLVGFYRYSFLVLYWRRHHLHDTAFRRLHAWLREATGTTMMVPPAEDPSGRQSIVRAQIIDFLRQQSPGIHGKTLDVGVGTWTFDRELLADHCDYHTTDCFEHPNVEVISDIHHLTDVFPRNEFDCLICTDVLEHVQNPWQAVGELWAVLKPGGKLLLTTPFNYPLHGYKPTPESVVHDFWRFTEAGLRELLSRFASVEVTACGMEEFPDSFQVVAVK